MRRLATVTPCLALLWGCAPKTVDDPIVTFSGPYEQVSAAAADGRIEFTAGSGSDVVVEFLRGGGDDYLTDESDGVLRLTAVCFGEEEPGCNGGFLITVPADQRLDAQSTGGNLDFLGELTGTVTGSAASGEITFEGGGAVDATVSTGTGALTADFVTAPRALSFDTGASAMAVAIPAGRYTLDLDTTGTVTVGEGIEEGNGPTIRLHSGTGAIDLTAN